MAPGARRLEVPPVAAEKLVSSVSGESNRDLATRHSANEICRNLRAVGKRLIVDRWQERNDIECVPLGDDLLVVHGPEASCDAARERRFIIARIFKPD